MKLVILVLLPFAVSAAAVATRQASARRHVLAAISVTAALAILLFASNGELPSMKDLILVAALLGFPVGAAFLSVRLAREHSPYFGALLMGPLAFAAMLLFVVSIGVDAGWLRP